VQKAEPQLAITGVGVTIKTIKTAASGAALAQRDDGFIICLVAAHSRHLRAGKAGRDSVSAEGESRGAARLASAENGRRSGPRAAKAAGSRAGIDRSEAIGRRHEHDADHPADSRQDDVAREMRLAAFRGVVIAVAARSCRRFAVRCGIGGRGQAESMFAECGGKAMRQV